MNAGLDGVVFGRQTERIESHRLEHVVALHAFEARKRVGGSEVVPVSHVQLVAGGVREHDEHVEFRLRRCDVEVVRALFLPAFLPFGFDVGERILEFGNGFGHGIIISAKSNRVRHHSLRIRNARYRKLYLSR